MSQYIHGPLAVALLIAVSWATVFSLTNKAFLRGFRNLGILACYLLAIVFMLWSGWRAALVTWALFGLAGGAIYISWEVLEMFRPASGGQKPGIRLSTLFDGLFAWPAMIPEAVEYALTNLGIVSAAPLGLEKRIGESGASQNGGGIDGGLATSLGDQHHEHFEDDHGRPVAESQVKLHCP